MGGETMGIWELDPTFLEGVVKTLGPLATEFDDRSGSLVARAQSAQARGGSSDVSDRIRYASSIVGGHGDALRSESVGLQNRVVLARSADESPANGAPDSSLTLAGATAPSPFVRVTIQGQLYPSLAIITLAAAKGMAALTNAIGKPRSNDCVQYVTAVMEQMGISKRPGDTVKGNLSIYLSRDWTAAGFTHVASANAPLNGQTPNENDQIQRLNAARPKPGTFFEMGRDGSDAEGGVDMSDHHAGIYLGSKNGLAYVAQSNWDVKGTAPGVFSVDANGHVVNRLSADDVQSLANTPWGSDAGAKQALLAMWVNGKPGLTTDDQMINFYAPPAK